MKRRVKKTAFFVLALTGALSMCQPTLGKSFSLKKDETAQVEEIVEETDPSAPPEREIDGDVYYELDSAEDLFWFAEKVNSGETEINAVLTDNITINSEAYDGTNGESLTEWIPIERYKGSFDGQNHIISGLYVNTSDSYGGLFGTVFEGGIIKNLGITDSYIRAGYLVGAVCGQMSKGTMSGCYNTGIVEGGTHCGAVCGQVEDGTISGCYNTGIVKNGSFGTGGICGASQGGTITNCYNTGDVSAHDYAAGICGSNEHGGTISYCYNTGEITTNRYYGYYTGGICANNIAFWGDTLISHCYNTGTLNGWTGSVAGICARNSEPQGAYGRYYNLNYENCYYLDTTAKTGTLGIELEGVESKTAEEFENGVVAGLLNDGSDECSFVQNTETDSSPVLAVFNQ
ncbi:MAG: hypothetical protein LUC92_09170 [Clostridiales bacterium]|nr:hypothetical protein [Clostridiales bacterium]